MRIPDIAFFDTFIKYDRLREKDLDRYTRELASGKKILTPSDNTVDNIRSLRFKRLTSDIQAYNRNIDMVKTSLDVAESTLGNIVDAAQETRVEIIQLLNTGVLDEEDANVLRDYFDSMRNYIIKQANVKIGDSGLFGGVKTQIDAFDTRGIYQGEFVETTVPISKGVELNTTFNGVEYLGTIQSGVWNDTNSNNIVDPDEVSNKIGIVKALDDIIQIIDSGELYKLHGYFSDMGYNSSSDPLVAPTESGTLTIRYGSYTLNINYDGDTADPTNPSTLDELVNAINSDPTNQDIEAFVFQDRDGVYRLGLVAKNDPSTPIEVSDSSGALMKRLGSVSPILETFDKGFKGVSAHRSIIGTQINVADNIKSQNELVNVLYSELISKIEDTDYAGVISELEKSKTAYQALLASIAQNKDLSLLKFYD
ncbi:flagellar hook-associated protein 3 FlgL [Persephonella hydrogeniphila]|uniref:Flagellar hook-associated protein 3 FlgL n=1 Tax=Persephonella hydrogeniphila TaxID=198703 RepID=A0A285N340_9AQUI|nr:flagellar hook-associated protein FlgL [Persephonella hydrogeniphila]SNZ03738.1 flagellar hook-associated protein 3 FlgL [Persephonella hydrogeniphila]